MLLEQQLELRRVIAYTPWVLPRACCLQILSDIAVGHWGFRFVDAAEAFLPLLVAFEVSPSPLMPPYSILGA